MMRRWTILAALILVVAAFGLGWAAAQPKAATATLTAQDYFEIQMLYGRYTHSIDHGQKDGMDYASVFLPDGILIAVQPKANPCPNSDTSLWQPATREDLAGSISIEKNVDVCAIKMIGTQKLAALAAGFKSRQQRHIHTNFLLTPTAEGATGLVYLNELNTLVKPPVITSNGIYNDTLVRTPSGWKFKKRIITQNAVFVPQK